MVSSSLTIPARHTLSTLAAAAALLVASPASATFHFAHISRLMTGLDGTTDVQYVEIEMESSGQNQVNGSKLIAFKRDGTFSHVVLTVSGGVASGSGRPWIMASDGFAAASGITPDFTFDSSDGKGLLPKDGMVCWGKPSNQTDPNSTNMVDCVSYGIFTGPANDHASAPSNLIPFGHGLVRVGESGDGADDFECEAPAQPRNNVPTSGSMEATSPCTGCGNYIREGEENCDDGDNDYGLGDLCRENCVRVPCGIPLNIDDKEPKASDALHTLKSAVGTAFCDLFVCDVDSNKKVLASDALMILRRAVGQPVEFDCL